MKKSIAKKTIANNPEIVGFGKKYVLINNALKEIDIQYISIDATEVKYMDAQKVVWFIESTNDKFKVKVFNTIADYERDIQSARVSAFHESRKIKVPAKYKGTQKWEYLVNKECSWGIATYVWADSQPKAEFTALVSAEFDSAFRVINAEYETEINECYESRQTAFQFNEYDVITIDGKTEHIVGAYKKMALTKEQREAVNAFQKALELLKEKHVCVCAETDSSSFYFLNRDANYEMRWRCDLEDTDEAVSPYFLEKISIPTNMDCWSCFEDNVFVPQTNN